MKPAVTSNKFLLLLFLVQSISHFFSTRLTMIDSKLKLFDEALVFVLKGTCSANKSKSFFISSARDSIKSLIVEATREERSLQHLHETVEGSEEFKKSHASSASS